MWLNSFLLSRPTAAESLFPAGMHDQAKDANCWQQPLNNELQIPKNYVLTPASGKISIRQPVTPLATERQCCVDEGQFPSLGSQRANSISQWLLGNYQPAEGHSVSRQSVYRHYQEACRCLFQEPINNATFGKLIRVVFPNLKTRRLGTRGHSKYHYYGIRRTMDDGCGVKIEEEGCALQQTNSNVNVLLDEYQQHCANLVDLASRRCLDDIASVSFSFWKTNMPQHRTLLNESKVIGFIAEADRQCYQRIAVLLVPDCSKPWPIELAKTLRCFARKVEESVLDSLESFAIPALAKARYNEVRILVRTFMRKTALNHLANAANRILTSPSGVQALVDDWAQLDMISIVRQAESLNLCDSKLLLKVMADLGTLLQSRTDISGWLDWAQHMIDSLVFDKCGRPAQTYHRARHVHMQWSMVASLVMRDVTLRSSPSFGAFHLLRLFLDEVRTMVLEERLSPAPGLPISTQSSSTAPISNGENVGGPSVISQPEMATGYFYCLEDNKSPCRSATSCTKRKATTWSEPLYAQKKAKTGQDMFLDALTASCS